MSQETVKELVRLSISFPVSEVGCTPVVTNVGYKDQRRAGGRQDRVD